MTLHKTNLGGETGVANFGNWKGSRAGKIKLHLVRPLRSLKSPGKPTKNILGLKNNKRHVRMHIHTQLVHQWVLSLREGSPLTWHTGRSPRCRPEASPSAGSLPPDAVPLSALARVGGRAQRRLPSSEIWGQFRNTVCSLLALLGLSPGPLTTQTPKADQ